MNIYIRTHKSSHRIQWAVGALWAILLSGAILMSCARPEAAGILRVALSGSPNTLDPHQTSATLTFQVTRSIYDTLVEPNSEGIIVPALAEQWEVSEDGLRWRFFLRKGVRFHNDQPLTAQDVKASLERLRELSPRAAEFSVIETIEVIDTQVVELRLSTPHAPLLASLGSGWAAILPNDLIMAEHDFAFQPVGSGPFRFEQWIPDGEIVLSHNSSYWKEGRPFLMGVVFHILTENAIRVQALLRGDIDVLDIIEPADIPRFEEDPHINIDRQLSSLAMVLPLNNAHPLLGDLRVRQAMSHAIDRQRVLDEAYGGGIPINTFMDYSDPYYPAITHNYHYDPQQARDIIQRYNLPIDEELELTVPQNFEPHIRAAEIYQQMFTEIGMNVRLKLVDWPTWIGEVYTNANYELSVIGHTGRLDPDARFAEYGYTQWNNDELTELVVQARQVVAVAERQKLYTEALAIMARELPFIFVGTNYRHVVSRNTVNGLILDNKLDTFDFRETQKTEE